MLSTLRLPALGVDEQTRDGRTATFYLATLHKMDRPMQSEANSP